MPFVYAAGGASRDTPPALLGSAQGTEYTSAGITSGEYQMSLNQHHHYTASWRYHERSLLGKPLRMQTKQLLCSD